MNRPVPVSDLLDVSPAPSSLAPKGIARRNNKEAPAEHAGESTNPPADTGVFIDHRKNGGPLLHVPESVMKHVDRIGADMRREDALFDPSPEAVEQAVEKMAAVGATARQIAVFAGVAVRAAKEASRAPGDFDWLADESVVVSEQSAVAIYFNSKNELVIRQEKSWCDDDDHFVVIAQRNVVGFIDKLCDLAGIPSFGK